MKSMTSGTKTTDTWSDDNLKYRFELLFGKAPRYPMELDDYLNHLDGLDIEVPFSFTSLIIIREQYATLKELIFPVKGSRIWTVLDNAHEEIVVFADPLLKGKNSLWFCRSTSNEDDTRSVSSIWMTRWGNKKQGMIISSSLTSSQTVISVPGNWFATK